MEGVAEIPVEIAQRADILAPAPVIEQDRKQSIKKWYKGPLVGPVLDVPEQEKITAAFNGPLFSVQQEDKTRFFLMPRVMNGKQIPGRSDKTTYFGMYELFPEEGLIAKRDPIDVSTIKGDIQENAPYNLEDIRVTHMPNGWLGCVGTAETDGTPYSMRFFMKLTDQNIWEVVPMEIMKGTGEEGLGPGKNGILLDWDTALHRLEKDDDTVVVTKEYPAQNEWRIEKKIVFPHITEFNKIDPEKLKKRIGLTGGERIPMENGNFRMIIHEVTRQTSFDAAGRHDHYSYQFRLAEFTSDDKGYPELVSVDPEPLMTYEGVVGAVDPAKKGESSKPDPSKDVIYMTGWTKYKDKQQGDTALLAITLYDKEMELFQIPFSQLTRPFQKKEIVA